MVKSWLCAVVCTLALVSPSLAASGTMRVPLHEGRLRTSDLSADLLKRLHLSVIICQINNSLVFSLSLNFLQQLQVVSFLVFLAAAAWSVCFRLVGCLLDFSVDLFQLQLVLRSNYRY